VIVPRHIAAFVLEEKEVYEFMKADALPFSIVADIPVLDHLYGAHHARIDAGFLSDLAHGRQFRRFSVIYYSFGKLPPAARADADQRHLRASVGSAAIDNAAGRNLPNSREALRGHVR
jgi:hypothetical protein